MGLLLASIRSGEAATILSDDFDSYAQGTLLAGQDWPHPIPDSPDNISWRAWHYGTQTIVDATSFGRTGNVYGSTVNPGTPNNDSSAYSFTRLIDPYAGNDTWTVSFDFYIESLSANLPANITRLVSVFDTEGANNYNNANLIGAVFAQESGGVYTLGANLGSTAVGGANLVSFGGSVNAGQWYTVSIIGNNEAQTLKFVLNDGSNKLEIDGFYRKNTREVNGFAIGSMGSVITGTYYLDNFEVSVIPEPSVSLLFGISAMTLLAMMRKKSAAAASEISPLK